MSDLNINERLALAKISEHISSLGSLEISDLIWISKTLDIIEYYDTSKSLALLLGMKIRGNNTLTKDELFDFFIVVYKKDPDKFPKIMEEVLRKFFLKMVDKLKLDKSTKETKSSFDMINNTIKRHLEILGYNVTFDIINTLDLLDVQLIKIELHNERREEQNKLFNVLEKQFKNEYIGLKGAYERYLEGGTNANRQAISSCRNTYENFFKKITGKQKWKEGLKEITLSTTIINLIKNVYSYLSGFGDHSPKEREEEDTLLAIRLTEDIFIRVLSKIGFY